MVIKQIVPKLVFLLFTLSIINCYSQSKNTIQKNNKQFTVDKNVVLKVLNCEGDINSKTVTVNFEITSTSTDTDRVFITDAGNAFATNGKEKFGCTHYKLGKNSDDQNTIIDSYILPNQTITGSITYGSFLNQVSTINTASFLIYNNIFVNGIETISKTDTAELKDLSVNWGYWLSPKPTPNLVSLGIGVTSLYFKHHYSASNPINTTLSYERKLYGLFYLGGNISYGSYKYTYQNYYGNSYSFNENVIYLGLKASYSINDLITLFDGKINPKIEPYLGLSGAYDIVNTVNNSNNSNTARSGFCWGGFAGVRYLFVPKFGVFGEVGYDGLSLFNIGIATKF